MLPGLTDKVGGACTVKVTETVEEADPRLKSSLPEYVPGGRFAFKFDAVTVRFDVAPLLSAFPVELMLSQFARLSITVVSDHVPTAPQLLMVTDCVGGSLIPAMPVKLSVCGAALMQPACTVNVTFNVIVELLGWLRNVTVAV
jgi:hypothetical protein